jgi:hypothetical protein
MNSAISWAVCVVMQGIAAFPSLAAIALGAERQHIPAERIRLSPKGKASCAGTVFYVGLAASHHGAAISGNIVKPRTVTSQVKT